MAEIEEIDSPPRPTPPRRARSRQQRHPLDPTPSPSSDRSSYRTPPQTFSPPPSFQQKSFLNYHVIFTALLILGISIPLGYITMIYSEMYAKSGLFSRFYIADFNTTKTPGTDETTTIMHVLLENDVSYLNVFYEESQFTIDDGINIPARGNISSFTLRGGKAMDFHVHMTAPDSTEFTLNCSTEWVIVKGVFNTIIEPTFGIKFSLTARVWNRFHIPTHELSPCK